MPTTHLKLKDDGTIAVGSRAREGSSVSIQRNNASTARPSNNRTCRPLHQVHRIFFINARPVSTGSAPDSQQQEDDADSPIDCLK